ncbi:MAG TPA: alpha/beta hydrolase [Pirellulales bacterium]|nr:alpha/beta hydrolase [Pirellulales bacterium]
MKEQSPVNARRSSLGLLTLLMLSLAARSTSAAALTDARLVMDGSSQPPGDRIDCTVSVAPEDRSVRLDAVAYVLEPGKAPSPIRAAGQTNRDPIGLLLVTLALTDKASSAPYSIVVPYADMVLDAGEHKVGYVVTLYVGDQVAWTQPLPATRVRVTGATRTELKPLTLGNHGPVKTEAVDTIVQTGSGSPSRRRVQLSELARPKSTEKSSQKSASVAVRGGFERTELPPKPVTNSELSGLANQPWQPLSDVADRADRIVYFATNRLQASNAASPMPNPRIMFDATLSSDLALGTCTVNFPIKHHKEGELETANWWQTGDPETCFLVEAAKLLKPDELRASLGKDDVLLYVHGFNTTFDYAVLRAGQIQYDSEFPGKAMAFSWPSMGVISQYKADADTAEKSFRALADVLDMLAGDGADAAPGKGHVHVIAHSLGNRVFLGALHDLVSRNVWKPDEKHLGQVILAAPDVGASRFNNVIGYAIGAAEHVTYYYCRNDFALATSQQVNYYEPVGLYPYFGTGLDTINADGVDTSFINHDYYAAAPQVLSDLHLLLKFAYAPDKRMPPLTTHSQVYGHDHWSFLPVAIKEE